MSILIIMNLADLCFFHKAVYGADNFSPLSSSELQQLEKKKNLRILLPAYLPRKFKALPYEDPYGPGDPRTIPSTVILEYGENRVSAGEYKAMPAITIWEVSGLEWSSGYSPNIKLYADDLEQLHGKEEATDKLYHYKRVDINGHVGIVVRQVQDFGLNECSLTFPIRKTLIQMKSIRCDEPCEQELLKVARSMHFGDWVPKEDQIGPDAPFPRGLEELNPGLRDQLSSLVKALEDSDQQVRRNAEKKLRQMGPPVVSYLTQQLEQGSIEIRRRCLSILENMRSDAKEAVPALMAHFKDEDDYVRGRAAYAIGLINPKATEPIAGMIQLMHDPKPEVRSSVLFGLHWMKPSRVEVLEAMIQAISDTDEHVRETAILLVGELGPEARAAIPALTHALQDSNPRIQDRAAEALRKVQEEKK